MTRKEHHRLLRKTFMLDFESTAISELVLQRGWEALLEFERIGAAYDFVRDEIHFGYNSRDNIPASRVLRDGYGQCNTKAILLMALLRRLRAPCCLRSTTIHKALQRRVVPEMDYKPAPDKLLHSWVEIRFEERWINLEGFIIDRSFLGSIQRRFSAKANNFCGYGIGTKNLANPTIDWIGGDTYVQKTGIDRDLGLFDDPNSFYARHSQQMGIGRGILYRHLVRHWMNFRVRSIRCGDVPEIPLEHTFQQHEQAHEQVGKSK